MVIRRIARVPPLPAEPARQDEMPDWSDRELLAALAENDPRAGYVLYDRLIRIVEWTILRIMGQRGPEHDDLVQGAFEQIVITLRGQRYSERCSLRAFRVEPSPSAPEPRDHHDLESQLAARQALERVRNELARMNPARAEALVLHEVNGLELAEIAALLGISVMAAQSRLSRGRRELMERLERAAPAGGHDD